MELAKQIAAHLGQVDGVKAVVVGGSRARGGARSDSDLDLGIYYHPSHPPALSDLRRVAQDLDDRHSGEVVTEFGEWGPWINGGGWLVVGGQPVDWLYRDLDKVRRVIDDCCAGRVTCDYQPGHPHGFHNHIYMGEVYYAQPLYDSLSTLAECKSLAASYPLRLQRAVVDKYLWEADFALATSHKSAARGETFYVAGCLFRCAACLVQVLFALNKTYFINEKGSIATVDTLAQHPAGFGATVTSALAQLGATSAQLETSIARLEALVQATRELCETRS